MLDHFRGFTYVPQSVTVLEPFYQVYPVISIAHGFLGSFAILHFIAFTLGLILLILYGLHRAPAWEEFD